MQGMIRAGAKPGEGRMIGVQQVAAELGVSPRLIYTLLAAGHLKRVRCGRAVRIERESLERFIEAGGARR